MAYRIEPKNPFDDAALDRAKAWLDLQIMRGMKKPYSEFIDLTPEIAWTLLGKNIDNRAIKANPLKKLIDDISNGLWQTNGETIIVSNEGLLNDGQHRCIAVVVTGITIRVLMAFGVSRSSRNSVDMGTARTAGDILAQNGVKHSNRIAAVVNMYETFNLGIYGIADGISKQSVVEDYYKIEDKVMEAIHATSGVFGKTYASIPLPTAYMLISERAKSITKVREFFHGVMTGEELTSGDARLQLRSALIKASKDKIKSHQKLELILRYWNSFREGRVVKASSPLLGLYPEIGR